MFDKWKETLFGAKPEPVTTLRSYFWDTVDRMVDDHTRNPSPPHQVLETKRFKEPAAVAFEIVILGKELAKAASIPPECEEETLIAACDISRKKYGLPTEKAIVFHKGDAETIRAFRY